MYVKSDIQVIDEASSSLLSMKGYSRRTSTTAIYHP